MIRDLSLRYKIPLRGTALILITALALTAALTFRAYDDLKSDLIANAEGMSRVMALTLTSALLKDDVWRAYEIVRTPFQAAVPVRQAALQAEAIVILNNRSEVYAASHPRRFPMLSKVADTDPAYARLRDRLANERDSAPRVFDIEGSASLYVATPIVSDGVRLGTLVVEYNRAGLTPRFVRFAERAAVVTVVVLGALLPVSWYWGARMAKPLVRLSECMGRIGSNIPAGFSCDLYESRDEIGQLGQRFRQMLNELKEKQNLERQVIAAERLAAVGRLTASIGHEINNPLGGMLNALNTFRRYGKLDPMAEKTVSLLERGLLQIRDTVSALLVEAKPVARHFGPDDAEDIRTLIAPDVQRQRACLTWDSDIGEVPLSATLIRQVLINLLLNAVKAVEPQGQVSCRIRYEHRALMLRVSNDGAPIPPEQLQHLFEPFVHYRADGNGLGLWVCYQIVNQLGGIIKVSSDARETVFTATIPTPR